MMHGPEGRLGPAGGKNWGMGKKGKTQLRGPVLAKGRWVMRGDTLYMSRAAYVCAQYLTTIKPSYTTHCS